MQYAPLVGANAVRSYSSLLLPLSGVRLTETLLGRGEYGQAILGHLNAPSAHPAWQRLRAATAQEESDTVAVKVLAYLGGSGGSSAEDPARLVQMLMEARLHASLSHPNLVTLLGVQEAHLPVMLVLEHCEYGNLRSTLRARAGSEHDFCGTARRDMARQVALALQYLHSKLCIHRDVAARNVLVSKGRQGHSASTPTACGYALKLADLGLSRALREEEDYYRVSECWRALF